MTPRAAATSAVLAQGFGQRRRQLLLSGQDRLNLRWHLTGIEGTDREWCRHRPECQIHDRLVLVRDEQDSNRLPVMLWITQIGVHRVHIEGELAQGRRDELPDLQLEDEEPAQWVVV